MGSTTCGSYPAFGCASVDNCTQAKRDVETSLSYGIDYIRAGSCSGAVTANFNPAHPLISSWFVEGGKKSGRPVLYHPSGIALHNNIWKHGTKTPRQYKLSGKVVNMWRHYVR
jgi:hypothetical protein